tara:strand:+ start:214 stop:399 length:186 start_codon:yes stop_codon:yes gene_type:complete
MNIKDLDDLNIKALLYDFITEKERLDESILVMRDELARREQDRQKQLEDRKKQNKPISKES